MSVRDSVCIRQLEPRSYTGVAVITQELGDDILRHFAPPPLALCMMIAKWLTGRNKRWVCLAFDAHSRVQLRRLFRLF
jgi:hypothetical protein